MGGITVAEATSALAMSAKKVEVFMTKIARYIDSFETIVEERLFC